MTLYMVIERFRDGPEIVYARFRDKGRMLPDGLDYVNSWVSEDLGTCFQIMRTDDPNLFEVWKKHWDDLVEFEITPIQTSDDAQLRLPVSSHDIT